MLYKKTKVKKKKSGNILKKYQNPDGPIGVSGNVELVDNPYYEQQLEMYNLSRSSKPAKEITATAGPDMLARWNASRAKNDPTYTGLSAKKLMYNPESIDPNTGLPSGAFLEWYNKPTKQFEQKITPKPTPAAPKESVYRDANTNRPLPVEIYGRPEGSDRTFSQPVSQFASTLEAKAARQNTRDIIAKNKELMETMSAEQLADMRARGLTAMEYLSVMRSGF